MIDGQKAQALFVGFRHYAHVVDAREFSELLERVQPNAATLSASLIRAATEISGSRWDGIRPALEAHLQLLLTQEHVAAQEHMSKAADSMAAASLQVAQEAHKTARLSFWLTFASVIVAVASLVSAVLIAQAKG